MRESHGRSLYREEWKRLQRRNRAKMQMNRIPYPVVITPSGKVLLSLQVKAFCTHVHSGVL